MTSGPKKGRAPPELAQLHPLGKAPQLVTADGRIIAESAAIASYLINTYDHAKRFQGDVGANTNTDSPSGGILNDSIRDESLTSFASSSLWPIEMIKLLLDIAVIQTPFFLRPLVRLLTSGVDGAFTGPELKTMLEHLERELGGQDYFMGTQPGRADFMLSFPLDHAAHVGWVDFGREEYKGLNAWRERCQSREAWKRALEKGNGYDMAFFKKG